jgi:hypothetical protein
MAKAKSKTPATAKRKSPRTPASAKKKSKTRAPETMMKEFDTKYGSIMFGLDGMFPLTPAESARCGLLLQCQRWYLDKAEHMGLQDSFEFTLELADDLTEEEAEMVAQGQEVGTDSLEVFADLIDAVGKLCNFDQPLGTRGELGVVISSNSLRLPMLIVTGEGLCSILTHLGCP